MTDSNRRPSDYKSDALPTELIRQLIMFFSTRSRTFQEENIEKNIFFAIGGARVLT